MSLEDRYNAEIKKYRQRQILVGVLLLAILALLFFLPSTYQFNQSTEPPRSTAWYILSSSGIFIGFGVFGALLTPFDDNGKSSTPVLWLKILGILCYLLVHGFIALLLCERFVPSAIGGHWMWNYALNVLVQLGWLLVPMMLISWAFE